MEYYKISIIVNKGNIISSFLNMENVGLSVGFKVYSIVIVNYAKLRNFNSKYAFQLLTDFNLKIPIKLAYSSS